MPHESGYESARATILANGLEISDEQRIGDPAGRKQIIMVSGFVVIVSKKRFSDMPSACEVAAIRLEQLASQMTAIVSEPSVIKVSLDLMLDCGRPIGWSPKNQPELPQRLSELARSLCVSVDVTGTNYDWITSVQHWKPDGSR
ncbi:MAG: hypothetical protein ACRC8S_10575 [Fimbriiglobus sp.]